MSVSRRHVLACIVLVVLCACGCKRSPNEVVLDLPVFVSPDELVGPEIFQRIEPDFQLSDPSRQDIPGSPGAPATPPELPADGFIPPKGGIDEFTGCTDGCSCQTVTLVRVETRDFLGTTGWFGTGNPRFRVTRIFDLSNPALPPQSGPLRFPARNPGDQVCFYFSYPPCFAYFGRFNGNHPCRVKVDVSFPAFNKGPNFLNKYQLYSVRGVADFATGTRNVICVQPSPNRTIPAGSGSIAWSVRDTTCQTVNFTVF